MKLQLRIEQKKLKKPPQTCGGFIPWSHLGSNQGPPDYESGALTN